MKKKMALMLLFLFCSLLLYSQDKGTDLNNNRTSTFLVSKNTDFLTAYSFDCTFLKIKKTQNYFYSSNKTTGFREGYYLNSRSEIQYPLQNNAPFIKTNSPLNQMYQQTDSFNPHGTQHLGAAVVLGLFDLVFAKK